MTVKDWSTTPSSNTTEFPEGQLPSSVNNNLRQIQADLRAVFESIQWFDFGHTPTYASSSSFTVSGDLTAIYDTGRRLNLADATTLYGTITSSSYSAPNTTVNVSLDSGSLSASLSSVAVGALSGSNNALPLTFNGDISAIGDHIHFKTNASGKSVIVKDPVNAKNATAFTGWVAFQDTNDAEAGWVGYGSTGNKTLKMYNNEGDIDFEAVSGSTVTIATKEVLSNNGTMYHGRVSSAGVLSGNSGFSSARVSTGYYGLTHNLGHTNYTILLTTLAGNNYSTTCSTAAANLCDIHVTNHSGVAVDGGFFFQIIPD